MKTPRSAFIFLTALTFSGALLAPAHAEERKSAKHKESASWNFDSFGDWFQEMGEGLADTFSGPRRTAAPFKWTGKIAAGKTFEVRGINGKMRATAASGPEVELVAIRSGRRNDPESVKIEVVPHAGGVTVCAVYPSRDAARPNECKPGGGHMNTRNNDVNVEFELRIPKDVNFEGRTVNGSIEADIEGRAALSTVNGRIEVVAGTLTEATTVNGSIKAEVKSAANPADDIKLSTVNGSVHLSLPEDVNADVSAKTVNGGITSDFTEIEVRKKWGPRSAEGRLGHGGRELELATVNGGIRITKGN
ncbi:MAG: DUF4097 family beta strand repeat-containing protein [Vicinamibacteria bacterium]|nr:DUF4097 family beta strand repeat-containing protein [Vicinamibacteria bacterium]